MTKTVAQPTLKEQTTKLNQLIEWFYSDDFVLEEAVEKYQQAYDLSAAIERNLLELKNQIEILPEDFTKN